jgi:hypothetical protein
VTDPFLGVPLPFLFGVQEPIVMKPVTTAGFI